MNNRVSIGVTSVIGWLTAFMALLPTIIKAIEEGQVAFNGPEKYLAIFGIASGLVTNVARYLQAHKLISFSSTETVSFEEGPVPSVPASAESSVSLPGPSNAPQATSAGPASA